MFLGHFAVAFAAKRIAPKASLGSLVLAALFADLLWSLLLLAGIERAQVVPGATVMAPLVFERYPWSHSLAMLLLVGAVAGVSHFLRRYQWRTAWVLALLVPGHWLLDWLVHVPDLPLTPGVHPSLHGLGLWNSMVATLVLELGLFTTGVALYLRATRPRTRAGTLGLAGLLVVLGLVDAGNVLGPSPPDSHAVAWVGQAQWLFVLWALWVDRHRTPREATA